MENLKLTRIGFRLIHRQVMTRQVAKYEIGSIVVIDNRSAKSPILKKILLDVAPSGVEVLVWNVAEVAGKWKAQEFPKNNLLILLKNISQAKAAWEAGVEFPSLQVGGTEGSGDKKNIYKNVVMSKTGAEELNVLYQGGVDIFMQPIPEDSPYPFKDALAEFQPCIRQNSITWRW